MFELRTVLTLLEIVVIVTANSVYRFRLISRKVPIKVDSFSQFCCLIY